MTYINVVINGVSFNVYYDDYGLVDVMLPSDAEGVNLRDVISYDVYDAISAVVTKGEGFKS